jgi:pyruvate/2-oxoacid:ferredoxin oxidoreductase alpha subunit
MTPELARRSCDPSPNAEISVGSSVFPLLEWWLALPAEEQDNSSVIALHLLRPFPSESLRGLRESREIIVVEQSYSGQVAGLLAQHLGVGDKIKGFRKHDGMPNYCGRFVDC